MNTPLPAQANSFEHQSFSAFTEKAYLDYSMYVILDRALPDIRDGLKPVQRRIVYAMSELGIKAGSKFKKSARTVGDVLGKYHPHGDAACYEAMVHLAQSFNCRYPLVDGQGNWGSQDDPKSFAAMRYTEARLTPYTETLLAELVQGTVDWTPNFDGALEEPVFLPSRLPNVLINGTTGIAVGMSTDIPPHNLRETAEACIHLLENPGADIHALCGFIKGPDYPTGAEIVTPAPEIEEMYTRGTGTIRMRAVFCVEEGEIVITALPYQVSGSRVLEQIASQMQAKKLPMVADLRDESDHEEPVRIVIVPRSNRIDIDGLMAHLFATTDLEKTCRVNLNMIGLNGRPQVKNLKLLLGEWISFRTETVRRRLHHRLEKVKDRLHILAGLMIAYLNIDEVIRIIRNEDAPKPVLMERFGLTDRQAEAILELRLRHLARLEEMKIRGEQDALSKEEADIEKILNSPRRLKNLIRGELALDAEQFGDARKTPIVEREEAQAMNQTEMMPVEPVSVILSTQGWVRLAKGHDVDPTRLTYKSGDGFKIMVQGRSNQPVYFLDSNGRSYTLPAHGLPSARGYGEPLSGRLHLAPNAIVETAVMAPPDRWMVLSSDAGYGFVAKVEDLFTRNRNGKAVITLPQESRPLPPVWIRNRDSDLLVAVSTEGRMLVFPVRELPELARGKGNKIIHIPTQKARSREELLMMLTLLPAGWHLTINAGKRQLKLKPGTMVEYLGERGRRGRKLPRGFRNVDRIEIEEPVQMEIA